MRRRRLQAAKTETAFRTTDILLRKTIQLQGKPMMNAMLGQRIRQPQSASVISNSCIGKLLGFEGLLILRIKASKRYRVALFPHMYLCTYASIGNVFCSQGPVSEKSPSKVSRSSQAQKWPVLSVIPHWEVFSLKCL